MVLLKCILWFWAAQVAFAVLLLARYGLGELRRVVSERLTARKTAVTGAVEMEGA